MEMCGFTEGQGTGYHGDAETLRKTKNQSQTPQPRSTRRKNRGHEGLPENVEAKKKSMKFVARRKDLHA
jgi:hypothetical protein